MERSWSRWTKEDIETLKTMAQKHPQTEIALALNRSAASIVTKAHDLGLSLRCNPQRQSSQLSASDPTG